MTRPQRVSSFFLAISISQLFLVIIMVTEEGGWQWKGNFIYIRDMWTRELIQEFHVLLTKLYFWIEAEVVRVMHPQIAACFSIFAILSKIPKKEYLHLRVRWYLFLNWSHWDQQKFEFQLIEKHLPCVANSWLDLLGNWYWTRESYRFRNKMIPFLGRSHWDQSKNGHDKIKNKMLQN